MFLLGVSLSRWRGLCPGGDGLCPGGMSVRETPRVRLRAGGTHPTGMFSSCRPQRSCGKVMISHLSVILFTGAFWQTPPSSRRPLQRTVRILLECILVFSNIFTLPGQTKGPLLTALHLLVVLGHVVWSDAPEELDVVVTVELRHLFLRSFVRSLQSQTNKGEGYSTVKRHRRILLTNLLEARGHVPLTMEHNSLNFTGVFQKFWQTQNKGLA